MSTETSTRSRISTWQIDPVHSQVEFGVRHMMISTVKGVFSQLEGSVQLNEEDFSSSEVEVSIDAASIDTGSEDRDQHLRSGDFLNVEEFPSLTFRSDSVEGNPDDFTLTGGLTIRGTTRQVTFQAERLGEGQDPWGNERQAFRAETTISRKEFGLTWNQALESGGVLVGDKVSITLEVQVVHSQDDEEG